jgi:hypothetical protein
MKTQTQKLILATCHYLLVRARFRRGEATLQQLARALSQLDAAAQAN